MSLHDVMQWLADSSWSIALHESQYGYAIVESVHVWAICLFVGFAVVLDLRLLGVSYTAVPVSQITNRLLPWTKFAFAIMVLSGALLFYAIPVRSYHNVFFRAKAALLLLAGLNAWLFHTGVAYRDLSRWDSAARPPLAARLAGGVSLVLWAAIIFCGRMIAYNWYDCDSPQLGSTARWLAGCLPQ
jgi:hypothetical protein